VAGAAAALEDLLAAVAGETEIDVRAGAPWGPGFLDPAADDLGPAARDEMSFVSGDARVAGSRLVRSVVLVSMSAVHMALTRGVAPVLWPHAVRMRPRRHRHDLAAFAIGTPELRTTGAGGRPALLLAVGADAGAVLAPAIERIYAATRLGRPAQWGLAAWLLAEACLDALPGAGDAARRAAVGAVLDGDERLARRAPRLVVAPGEDDGVVALQPLGRACCLSHRWGDAPGYCWGCPLVGDEGRDVRIG